MVLGAALSTTTGEFSAADETAPPDTARIQAALDRCAGTGRAVMLAPGFGNGDNAFLSGPLTLGSREVLLSVPHYSFGWQASYRLEKPVPMPKGSQLHCLPHFDNSAKNPSNPDPKRHIYWGDQTWEEMMIGWIDYYVDNEKP